MAAAKTPYWALPKEKQKHQLEVRLHNFLYPTSNSLTPHERCFFAETIWLTNRGLFGLARQVLSHAYDDLEKNAHYKIDPEVLAQATPSNLRRALAYLVNTPARQYPIFC